MAERTISTPELILELLATKIIGLEDAFKYFQNYKYFEDNRAKIEQTHAGKAVASIKQDIVVADSIENLLAAISNLPDFNRAYLEQL